MKTRTTQSALLAAGAAVGVAAAAAWVGKRRSRVAESKPSWEDSWEEKTDVVQRNQVSPRSDFVELVSQDLIEADGPELPIGRSADPAIDDALRRARSWQDEETSGSALFAEPEPSKPLFDDISLDEIWDATPGFAEGEQTEGYDAVTPEDLGSVWLERATQTTHEARPHASDPYDVPDLEDFVSAALRAPALPFDAEDADAEDEEQSARDAEGDEDEDPNAVQDGDLDEDDLDDERNNRDRQL